MLNAKPSKINSPSKKNSKPLILLISLVLISSFISIGATRAETIEAPRIIGTVSSSDGPVAGAAVTLATWSSEGVPYILENTTDPEGSYEFENLTYGSDYVVEASFNGTGHSKAVQAANDTQIVDFRFTGSLEVEVKQPDGSAAVGVNLQLYSDLSINEANATTDSGGVGVFERLDAEDRYTVYLAHGGVPYSEIAVFDGSETSSIEIQILGTTTSDANMIVALHHVIVSQEGDDLGFWEVADYVNAGETVFNTSWLRGWMQPGAFDISHTSMDCCIQFSGEGPFTFDPMDPLFPGDKYILETSYTVEGKVPSQVIEQQIVYDTDALYFLIMKPPKVTAESLEGLELLGVETFGEVEYYNFMGADLEAGDVVSLRLKTELTVFEILQGNPLIWGSLLLLIPAGAVIYAVAFRKTREDQMVSLEKKKRELFSGLAEAEKDFDEGRITWDEFEELQRDYKKRSTRVLREIDNRSIGKKPPQVAEAPADERSETTDPRAELNAVNSVLWELRSDLDSGAITEDTYDRISAKYRERKSRIEERLRSAGAAGDEKAEEE